jgi:GNAT superfamily N-acetyltransferase
MTETLTVRTGTLNDLEEMMELAMMATDENSFVSPNPEKLLREIYPALCQNDGIVGIVGEPGGIIEGAVLLRVGTIWYSDEPTLDEKAIFVHPDYRAAKGGRARRLMEFSKSVADGLGITLTIGVMSSERTEAKIRAYGRVFGPPSGAYWLYGAKTASVARMNS